MKKVLVGQVETQRERKCPTKKDVGRANRSFTPSAVEPLRAAHECHERWLTIRLT
jgi:hypothetical protein